MLRRSGLAAALWAGVACSDIASTTNACEQGSDCVYPNVCCTDPRIPPYGKKIPYCEEIDICNAYLPFLVAGNPCERGSPARPELQQCGAPLVCCPKSLTCATEADCAAAPEPVPTVGSGAECGRDADCAEGEVCGGIDLLNRDGRCRALVPASPMTVP